MDLATRKYTSDLENAQRKLDQADTAEARPRWIGRRLPSPVGAHIMRSPAGESCQPGGGIALQMNKGARWEIIVDGKPRSYRDCKETALEGARFLKGRNPTQQVLVRDLEGVEADL